MSVNMKVGQGFAVYFVTRTQNPQTRIGVFSSIRFYDWVNILFLPLLSENSCDIYAYMFSFFLFLLLARFLNMYWSLTPLRKTQKLQISLHLKWLSRPAYNKRNKAFLCKPNRLRNIFTK